MENWSFKIGLFLFLLLWGGKNNVSCQENLAFKSQRENMVKHQIERRGISDDGILKAFRMVPRHLFVLPEYVKYAYTDSPLPINAGQTISQPYIVAFMTDVLDLKRSDRVLEVGTGSGYQAAILSQLCDSVYTIELFEELSLQAQKVFMDLAYDNIFCKVSDGYKGWFQKAPFDAIIVTCSPTHIPDALKDQLAEGGRMIIPVGEGRVQQLVLLHKRKGKLKEKNVLPVRFVPMLDENYRKY